MTVSAPRIEARRHKRYKVQTSAKLRHGPTGQPAKEEPAQARDISCGGLFLYAQTMLSPGSEIQVVMMVPRELGLVGNQMVCCHARVVRIHENAKDGKHGVAAKIEKFAAMPQI